MINTESPKKKSTLDLKTAKNLSQIYERLGISITEIKEFCEKWQIIELALFGSILRDDFKSSSDIDFLATFDSEFEIDIFQLYDLEEELTAMVGRNIDFIFKNSLENSHNWLRKNHILATAEIIYVKG